MILIAFATILEAQATFKRFAPQEVSPFLYRSKEADFLITGVGMQKTHERISAHIHRYAQILNFGVAGALRPHLSLEESYRIQTVGHAFLNAPPLSIGHEGMALASALFPIHEETPRQQLATDFDLVDMEGFALAQAALQAQVPLTMWKTVSDLCAPGGSALIQQLLPKLSLKIAGEVEAVLCSFHQKI